MTAAAAASRPDQDLDADEPAADTSGPPHAADPPAEPPDAPAGSSDGAGPDAALSAAGSAERPTPDAEGLGATPAELQGTGARAGAGSGATAAGPVATAELPLPVAPAPDDVADDGAPAPRRRRASRRTVMTAFTAVFSLWVLLDQVTKELATRWFATDPVDLGFLRLVDVRNPNAAFGIPGFPGLFPLVTVVVVVLVLRVLPGTDRLSLAIAYGLVTGGAVGNVIDRLFRAPGFPSGSVVDFIDLGWWPVFNFADTGICIGAAIVAVQLSKVDHEEREAAAAAAAQPSVRPEPRPPHA